MRSMKTHHRSTPEQRREGVRQDVLSGWYNNAEICLRRGVSSKTVTDVRKSIGGAR
jgi:hypothetical protein